MKTTSWVQAILEVDNDMMMVVDDLRYLYEVP